ncbi:D-tagatose-1,6-bisphosphate aldolase subunit KbaY [bioreactor metagenome]|uniref:D-tagatose-1,6-bisphosphate aldolase subunit KbaY n=1 Tax=bioreactor metagenome TaxID=1076179 RepID=A0A644YAQ6_9ZZZZ
MGMCKTSELLSEAKSRKICVPAFNVYSYESIKWTLDVAQELDRPVIVMTWQGVARYMPLSAIAALTKELAKDVTVPVALHLDHSYSFEDAMLGVKYGFSSIMYDGSKLPLEENIKNTAEVAKAAHAVGVEVEGELGHVGLGSDLGGCTFTVPDEAVRFANETGVEALAVSIGNAHGVYSSTPDLQLDLLKELAGVVPCPLVLHGGSGIPAAQVRQAIGIGITKMNIATDFWAAMDDAVYAAHEKGKHNHFYTMLEAREPFKDFLRSRFEMLVGEEK